MRFEPIAIVGQAVVLPGALSPEQLWQKVVAGQDLVSSAPAGRWGIAPERILGSPEDAGDKSWSDRGGYVSGFEQVFQPAGFQLPEQQVRSLDPLVQWLLHCGREALGGLRFDPARAGAVVGNLSFPSSSMSRYAERQWLGDELAERVGLPQVDPVNRFMSGLPAHILAKALGLGGQAFALDAACASSLYALKLACDALQDRSLDLVLAGAVNRSDDLFIHVGFCALKAMSKSGQSRPFHAGADGLVPAEGAGLVALKRLDDARRDGDRILGVIRGIGLSNDGRGRGLLAPSSEGQVRALREAYAQAGLSPADIGLLECHATGTSVGDGTELRSMKQVFEGTAVPGGQVPIGSLKSNMGHLITAAGVAGLVKVLKALEHGQKPPTLHGPEAPHPELAGSPFRLLERAEAWTGPRRASVSAFGFGGNNAHLLVESPELTPHDLPATSLPSEEVVVVGLGAQIGDATGKEALLAALGGQLDSLEATQVELPLRGLRSPPKDLQSTLAQQTLVLRSTLEATAGLELPRERTGVLIGMGADIEVCRYGARWRAKEWGAQLGESEAWVSEAREAFVPLLESAGVLGTMPNIPANRLNGQLDLAGPSLTVSSEELSGLRAVEVAMRQIRRGELDAAVVGAVDVACEPVHEAALAGIGMARKGADAAVALVLMSSVEAARRGLPVLATLGAPQGRALPELSPQLGHAHAASGLLNLAAAILLLRTGSTQGPLLVQAAGLLGQSCQLGITATPGPLPARWSPEQPLLSLPAHPPRVQLPPVSSSVSREVQTVDSSHLAKPYQAPGSQLMAPAPALPSVHFHGPATPPPKEELRAQAPAPVAQPAPAPVVIQPPAASPHQGVLQAALQTRAEMAKAHAEFLRQSAQTQEAFLRLQSQQQAALLAAARNQPALPAPAPMQARAPIPTTPSFPVAPPPVVELPKPAPAPVVEAPKPPVAKAPPKPAAPRPVATPPAAPKPAAAKAEAPEKDRRTPTGPTLDREGLKIHASGAISEIYGDLFKKQDGYERQVRMPEPPLLLADRMTGLDAVPGSMKKGTIWTETDVEWDSWYLHEARMPAGIMIESGQADLMLISYLGIDFLNQSDRVYRLLGCDLTYHGGLPQPGDTLCYDIHVDGHANQGPIRLFFFHYDCEIDGQTRLTVRGGQAGFFTDAELDDSAGILWEPETGEKAEDPRLDPPEIVCEKSSFTREELQAYAEGRPWECFGQPFFKTQTHTRTPRISAGRMLFLQEVTDFDPKGGPWGRGYLRAIDDIAPDDWFFDGHFKNDPCMPGTLMFEGCLQAMAVTMAAMGFTVERDGWRFEPVPHETYPLRCRGQVIPSSQQLIYEIFVDEVISGPVPKLYADLLCTVVREDGTKLKAFHCRRMGLQLTPAWPLDSRPPLHLEHLESGLVKSNESASGVYPLDEAQRDFAFDYKSLLAAAWAKPSEAFGPMYERFDSPRKVARLPGPPYHFMSRVTKVDGTLGAMKPGQTIELEYDIPRKAWYFNENGAATMPFAVLLEAALQPCGWLASFVGSATTVDQDLFFRNLDGTGTLHVDLVPETGTLTTKVTITNISKTGPMIIESFDVECFVGDVLVYDLKTVFGFFPKEALENQKGLPVSDGQRELQQRESERSVNLRTNPERYCGRSAALAQPYLRMIDRVTGIWPTGGEAGLGEYRAAKDVNVGEWFFKAHFYQDPVQPGSLGIEAMIQLLQFAMLDQGMDEGMDEPRFEPLQLGNAMTWKYRGQVRTHNKLIESTIEITEKGEDERGRYAICKASLWVDDMRIYEAENLGMRLVESREGPLGKVELVDEPELLDPAVDTWLNDHCPTWTVPALPMMSMVDRLAGAAAEVAEGKRVLGLRDVQVHRWCVISEPTELRTVCTRFDGGIEVVLSDSHGKVASGKVLLGWDWAQGEEALAALEGRTISTLYESGRLFHGPAFQLLTELVQSGEGSSSLLDLSRSGVPVGTLNQALLDAATHGIPHDALETLSDEIPAGHVAYPARITDLDIHGPTPTSGEMRCEVRFDGFYAGQKQLPAFQVQLVREDQVWCRFRLVEALFPKGRIGSADPRDRMAFLRDGRFVPGLTLSERKDGVTTLDPREVELSSWLPGTISGIYGTEDVQEIAVREHLSQELGVHPSVAPDATPLSRFELEARDNTVRTLSEALDLAPVVQFWTKHFGRTDWPVEDLYYGMLERFVRRVVTPHPAELAAVKGRALLYLGNHQVGIESLLFSILASGLNQAPTVTLAKAEHRDSWLGTLITQNFGYPGITDPRVIEYFDRQDKASLPAIIQKLAGEMVAENKSVMVHVEGTRSLECRTPVLKMSGAFIDMALKVGAPIVPVRFYGGLPVDALEQRIEFPVGCGRQDIWIGRPILPEHIAHIPYGERKKLVIEAINALGPDKAAEEPLPGDAAFFERVQAWSKKTGVPEADAVLREVLVDREGRCSESEALLQGEGLEAWHAELAGRMGTLQG